MTDHQTIVPPHLYAAREITPEGLMGLVKKIGAVNTSMLDAPRPDALSEADVHALTAHLLSREEGERFPVGAHDIIALRFVCGGQPYTVLAVEDYHSPYPCLVDGHITTRAAAIDAWLGDSDESETPDLYLVR